LKKVDFKSISSIIEIEAIIF